MAIKTPVAVLGLGTMGAGMAGQLIAKGFDVTVYNRSAQRAQPLQALGAAVAPTPREAVKNAMFVISMLSDDAAAREVWVGTDGALDGVMRGAVLVESSTISVAWARELSQMAAARGCEMLDAPVTGTKPHAASAQLVFLVGGTEQTLARARPFLAAMSRDVIHLGPAGSGALVKLINNFVCGVQAVALAESIALIERTDLDAAKAIAVLTEGAPGSPIVKMVSQRMIASDYTPNFALKLMTKDMRYAIEEARSHSANLATAATALDLMQKAIGTGLGDKDFSSVIELLRK